MAPASDFCKPKWTNPNKTRKLLQSMMFVVAAIFAFIGELCWCFMSPEVPWWKRVLSLGVVASILIILLVIGVRWIYQGSMNAAVFGTCNY